MACEPIIPPRATGASAGNAKTPSPRNAEPMNARSKFLSDRIFCKSDVFRVITC